MVLLREDGLDLVRGRQIARVDGSGLRREAATYDRVVVDLGAGDGRFAYRLAQAHPRWFFLAVDANGERMRERSFRAGRKPSRGGVANVRFVRAAVERLPAALHGIADEIVVLFPWGSLLRAVIAPEPDMLGRIARLGKPGTQFRLRVNASILRDRDLMARLGLPTLVEEDIEARLVPSYAKVGIRVADVRCDPNGMRTSWGQRLNHGGSIPVVALDGTVKSPTASRAIVSKTQLIGCLLTTKPNCVNLH